MNYKLLGKSGLRVSELCLGTMTFGDKNWGFGASKEESKTIFDAFVSAGGTFIDTANIYSEGNSELYLGEFIKGNRDRFVIATKYTGSTTDNNPNAWGNHKKSMRLSIEKSLRQLQTDYIDLYWVHIWDFTTRTEEVMRGLDDLVGQGKVLYIGISDAPAWIISQANILSELQGWTPFTAIQIEYNLLQRTVEYDLLTMAKAHGLGVTAWSPLAMGILSGKFRSESPDTKREMMTKGRINERSDAIVDEVIRIAKTIGRSPSQVALNWLMQQSDQLFPIIGARKEFQLMENIQAADFTLDPLHLDVLDKISKPPSIFPYSMWDDREGMVKFLSRDGVGIKNWELPFQ